MKKRLIGIGLTAILLAGGLTACRGLTPSDTTSKEESKETVESNKGDYEYDWQQYIVPGGYTMLEVPASNVEISDELVDARIEQNLQNVSEQQPVEGRGIQDGDIVYFDYTSTVNGKTPVDGEGTDQMITIGSGDAVEGFDDGLLGASVGDTVDFSVDYPDDYWDVEYAGNTVNFTVTVTDVFELVIPELTDDLVQVISDHSGTVADYREEVREDLLEEYQDMMALTRETTVWQKAMAKTDVLSYPEEQLQAEEESMLDEYRQMAEEQGMTFEELKELYLDMDEDIEDMAKTTAQNVVLQQLLEDAIFDLEGLTVTDQDYLSYGTAAAPDKGYDSVDAWEKAEGKDAVMDEVRYRMATAFLIDHAVEVDSDEDVAAVLGLDDQGIVEEN